MRNVQDYTVQLIRHAFNNTYRIFLFTLILRDVFGGSDSIEFAWSEEDPVRFLGWEDPLEKGMATHSNILVWRTPWTEKPGGL